MSTSNPHRTSKPGVEVQILGQRMVLKASHDPEHVERLVGYVKRKIDELGAAGPVSSTKLAVLAALNIAEDFFRAQDETRRLKAQVAQTSRFLLDDLDHHSRQRVRATATGESDGE